MILFWFRKRLENEIDEDWRNICVCIGMGEKGKETNSNRCEREKVVQKHEWRERKRRSKFS